MTWRNVRLLEALIENPGHYPAPDETASLLDSEPEAREEALLVDSCVEEPKEGLTGLAWCDRAIWVVVACVCEIP